MEEGSGWGTHVNPWLIRVNVWQKPLQYCKVTSLQLIKINEKKNKVPSVLILDAVNINRYNSDKQQLLTVFKSLKGVLRPNM